MNNQKINGHQVLHKFWYVIFLIILVLSFCFLQLNCEFSEEIHKNSTTLELSSYIDTTNLKPQSLSFPDYSVKILEQEVWDAWQEAIVPIKSLNIKIFWFDNIWALFFCFLIYLVGTFRLNRSTFYRPLVSTLSIAYIFDLIENFTYLGIFESAFPVLPYVSFVKFITYILSVVLSLYLLVRSFKTRSP